MAETLRELGCQAVDGQRDIWQRYKGVTAAVKQAEANFKLAGAGVQNFENTLAGARAKVEMLTGKLTAQNQAVTKHQGQLDKKQGCFN